MNKPHKHAEVLRAIADGKTVQWNDGVSGWKDAEFKPFTPLHHEGVGFEWRVKPERKPDYCFYSGYDGKGFGGGLFNDRDDVNLAWIHCLKITIDGETNEPKSVELIK